MKLRIESKESVPIVETVRAALYHKGRFLILEKSADSKNPGAMEFPGGKIDDIKNAASTEEEQRKAAADEVVQETGINVSAFPIEKVEDFEMYFEVLTKDGIKKQYRRLVHMFLINLPDTLEINPEVNQTMNDSGKPEDYHKGFNWLTPTELIASVKTLEENPETGKNNYPLSRNSRHIKKLLQKVGYLDTLKA